MKVLISSGYGTGWSTWNDPMMALDERLIRAFECGISKEDMKELCVACGYLNIYGDAPIMGGFGGLKVVEVPSGAWFKIKEYDGSERLEIFNPDDYYFAEGEFYGSH